ncbi:acyl-CoA thioesterase [Alicyclobacillaceae bacterium I2511]|nr:acyl-CoA thioesterase [Alicyclobacillaceae bacterium I2511]
MRDKNNNSSRVDFRHPIESRAIKVSMVLPPDTNHYGTMFGGRLMSYIDDVATISATRHSRCAVVTASTDSVDFIRPVRLGNTVCLESFVTFAGRTSMEVFVKVTTEDLLTGKREVSTTAFLTFVALDETNRPTEVPKIVPQSRMEQQLYETAVARVSHRLERRKEQTQLISSLGTGFPWE